MLISSGVEGLREFLELGNLVFGTRDLQVYSETRCNNLEQKGILAMKKTRKRGTHKANVMTRAFDGKGKTCSQGTAVQVWCIKTH
jgi:hypothetical protein